MILRSFISIILILVAQGLFAQKIRPNRDNILLMGKVENKSKNQIKDGIVTVTDLHDSLFVHTDTVVHGKFEMVLPFDRTLVIRVSSDGYIDKSVEIDTHGLTLADRKGGYGIAVTFTLIKLPTNIEYEILKQPFGKAHYDRKKKNFYWDVSYTDRMREEQDRIIRAAGI
jgi:hypothetical protein